MALAGPSLYCVIAYSLKTAIDNEKDDMIIPTVVFVIAISDFEILAIASPFLAIVAGLLLNNCATFKGKIWRKVAF